MVSFVYPTREETRVKKYAVAGMVSLALTGIAQGAVAQDAAAKPGGPAPQWYIGAGLGEDFASIPQQTIDAVNSIILPKVPGATSSAIDTNKRSTGAKLFAGYSFSRYFAVEGGYAPLGTSSADISYYSGSSVLTPVGSFNMKYEMTAVYIDAVGSLPLSEKWSLIGRVGAAYGRTNVSVSGNPLTLVLSSSEESKSTVRAKFGAGVDYNLNPAFTVRAEWELYQLPDPLSSEYFDVNAATLSLLYRF
jgi:OOP family OmpA-OmpF porin